MPRAHLREILPAGARIEIAALARVRRHAGSIVRMREK
jgi:hypothetical protein